MKIIITGATGFIGRNIAEKLYEEGMEVITTGRSLQVGKELEKKGIKFIKADITDMDELKKKFSTVDCLIHCAARAGDWGSYKEYYAPNVLGTENVIIACKIHNIKKIIFISSPSIYYTGEDRYNVSEDEPIPEKQFHYSRTKLIAEKRFMELQQDGFKVIILRPRAVYGKYDNIFVPRILRMSEKRIPLINEGKALIDITYIDNLVNAIKCCLSVPENAWNEAYNISNGDPISVRDWFSQIMEIFNRPFNTENVSLPVANFIAGIIEFFSNLPFGNKSPKITRFSVGYLGRSLTMSIEKAKQKLNYKPLISNYDGFKEYKKWYNNEQTETS